MISVVLYGRNDSYGYNLHKRAAISLNCMAEVLNDPQDEIIFVDYNTPDDFPTFPEAVQDTLTEKAKALLRVLRVRPSHHERFRERTHLACLEPIARNVGIRRSNSQNRWILSTNTDMVFVPRRGRSLSEIATSLPDAYYHLPRFEVPETLWESVNRADPQSIIESFRRWGTEMHLNEIVYTSHRDVRYDGPGDFQLMLRSDVWRMHGFHEGMLLGWHVDSNTARRLSLLPRALGDVVDDLYGYHCDHTRQVTPAHRTNSAQNDQRIFYENVTSAEVPEQANTWGLAGEEIEELSVREASKAYLIALHSALSPPLDEPTATGYSSTSFNHLDYDPDHVVPFLADSFSSYPRMTILGWIGSKRGLLERFARIWHGMGFSEQILVSEDADWLGPLPQICTWANWEEICRRADALVFDFGKFDDSISPDAWTFDRDPIVGCVMRSFRKAVQIERARRGHGERARRFVGVNTICNAAEGTFNANISCALTPLATHIRQGFLQETDANLLSSLYIGAAGQRLATGIVALPNKDGYVFYGPYLDLLEGAYRFTIEIADVRYEDDIPSLLHLEVISNRRLIALREISPEGLEAGTVGVEFFIRGEAGSSALWPSVEFRLKTPGSVSLTVRRATLEPAVRPRAETLLRELEVSQLLSVGSAGEAIPSPSNPGRRAFRAGLGAEGVVAFGPHIWLEPGRYRATFQFNIAHADRATIASYAATHLGKKLLGQGHLPVSHAGTGVCTVEFDVAHDPPPASTGLLEFLVWSDGRADFTLTSVRVEFICDLPSVAREGTVELEVMPLLALGPAGKVVPGTIRSLQASRGVVFFGPYIDLEPGHFRFQMEVRAVHPNVLAAEPGLTVAVLADSQLLASGTIARHDLVNGVYTLEFDTSDDRGARQVEFVLRTIGITEVAVRSVTLDRTGPALHATDAAVDLLRLLEAPSGRWEAAPNASRLSIRSPFGTGGMVAYGPYIALPPGDYEVTFNFSIGRVLPNASIVFDVASGAGAHIVAETTVAVGRRRFLGRALGLVPLPSEARLCFTVSSGRRHQKELYEFRTRCSTAAEILLTGVSLRRTSAADRTPLQAASAAT